MMKTNLILLCFVTLLFLTKIYASDVIDNVTVITDDTFTSIVQSDDAWLIAFTAPWCGHCKSLEPIWKDLADQLYGTTHVAKVDATSNPLLATQFRLKGFPTIVYVNNNEYTTYPLEQGRSIDMFKDYIKTGYKLQPKTTVPEITTSMVFVAEIIQAYEDVKSVVLARPDIAITIFALGILAGVLFTITVFICCIDKRLYRNISVDVVNPVTASVMKKTQ